MEAAALLNQFGLTRQEASIYLALLSRGDLNGYEVAKHTGISRSNAYTSLASLVEKGAAATIEGSVVRYVPLPVADFCGNVLTRLNEARDLLVEILPSKIIDVDGYVTIRGTANIINRMKHMIEGASERVYISGPQRALVMVRPEIDAALQRKIKIVLITDEPMDLPGAIVYYAGKSYQQIRIIADSTNVLTGDLDDGEYSTCLYSQKKNLVDLLKDSLKNEIRLIEITERRGNN